MIDATARAKSPKARTRDPARTLDALAVPEQDEERDEREEDEGDLDELHQR